MNIQLIEGEFKQNDALALITEMIGIKVKYHENKISHSANEEDIKAREAKIKRLQDQLFELRNTISNGKESVKLNALLNID